MSATDPYAAPVVEEAQFEVEAPEPVEAPATEAAVEEAVPEGSIKVVLTWVGTDKEKAQRALDAENAADEPRTTLVKSLNELLD